MRKIFPHPATLRGVTTRHLRRRVVIQIPAFLGDYDHYITSHAWYANEIRIIRNDKDIHSWESASPSAASLASMAFITGRRKGRTS